MSRSHTPPAPPLWNIANILTGLRVVLVPVFLAVLFAGGGHTVDWRLAAAALFTVAAVTDKLDGMLARSLNLVTAFGKFVDPIADKALVGAAFIGLSLLGELPWWVTVVVLGRELIITLLRVVLLRGGVIAASRGGKWKTVAQSTALAVYLLPLPGWADWPRAILMGIAVLLTLATAADYLMAAWRERRR